MATQHAKLLKFKELLEGEILIIKQLLKFEELLEPGEHRPFKVTFRVRDRKLASPKPGPRMIIEIQKQHGSVMWCVAVDIAFDEQQGQGQEEQRGFASHSLARVQLELPLQ
jgi:hypothetical protein